MALSKYYLFHSFAAKFVEVQRPQFLFEKAWSFAPVFCEETKFHISLVVSFTTGFLAIFYLRLENLCFVLYAKINKTPAVNDPSIL